MGVFKLSTLLQQLKAVKIFRSTKEFITHYRKSKKIPADKVLRVGIDNRYLMHRTISSYKKGEGIFGYFNQWVIFGQNNVDMIIADDGTKLDKEKTYRIDKKTKKNISKKKLDELCDKLLKKRGHTKTDSNYIKTLNTDLKMDWGAIPQKISPTNLSKQRKDSKFEDVTSEKLKSYKKDEPLFVPLPKYSKETMDAMKTLDIVFGCDDSKKIPDTSKSLLADSMVSKTDSNDKKFGFNFKKHESDMYQQLKYITNKFRQHVKSNSIISAEENDNYLELLKLLNLTVVKNDCAEADHILHELEQLGVIDFIFSGDTDLLARGCKLVFYIFETKVYVYDLKHILKVLKFKTHDQFVNFCTWLGTDYIKLFPNLTASQILALYQISISYNIADIFDIPTLSKIISNIKSFDHPLISSYHEKNPLDLILNDTAKTSIKGDKSSDDLKMDHLTLKSHIQMLIDIKELILSKKKGEVRREFEDHVEYITNADNKSYINKKLLNEQISASMKEISTDVIIDFFSKIDMITFSLTDEEKTKIKKAIYYINKQKISR